MADYAVINQVPRSTAVVRARLSRTELPAFLARSIADVLIAIEELGATPAGEPFAHYHVVTDDAFDAEAGFPVTAPIEAIRNVIPAELPGGPVVVGIHNGAGAGIATSYAGMRAWASAHGLQPADDMWEIQLTDPEREPNPERWQTALFLKVGPDSAGR